MTLRSCTKTAIALIIFMAPPVWGQQYLLYSPQPVTSEERASSPDGILVKEIEIQKGDTLSALSRKFSGRGTYYPQILLFNSIKNPDLIYAGDTLRVPVNQNVARDADRIDSKSSGTSRKTKSSRSKKTQRKSETQLSSISTSSTELATSDLKTVVIGKNKAGKSRKKTAVIDKKTPLNEPTTTLPETGNVVPVVEGASSSQKLFEAAVKAYRLDDCRTALDLLDRYLVDNSNSPLAADANLYKAECYLKLSGQ